MRLVNTLILGILLAATARGSLAQTTQPAATPASKTSSESGEENPQRKIRRPGLRPSQRKEQRRQKAKREPAGAIHSNPWWDANRRKRPAAKNLPPGKAGLQVSTLRLDGIVRSSNGMIAMVSNPQARTYFLREGDQLYDGKSGKRLPWTEFRSMKWARMPSEKPVERQVNKRIYSTAGEQQ